MKNINKYIIMCGGKYSWLETPKQLTEINGEPLVARTIRLLKENGITDIAISSKDSRFDNFGVPRIEHNNEFEEIKENGKEYIKGYWVDAFYPTDEPVCYLYGDVYYSENCIKTIVETQTMDILFFASTIPCRPDYFKMWEEPFAFKVANQERFKQGIEICKQKRDKGETNREPISWELYRVLNGIDINTHKITTGFIAVNDVSTDIDCIKDKEELEKILNKGEIEDAI